MTIKLHIKICEAERYGSYKRNSDFKVSIGLKSQDPFVQQTEILTTSKPIWNQEFDFYADPNDILEIYINQQQDYEETIYDNFQYPISTWPVGNPIDRKEITTKHKDKISGIFIFEVQSFSVPNLFPQEMKINIHAFDARNVLKMDLDSKSDPYLQCSCRQKNNC